MRLGATGRHKQAWQARDELEPDCSPIVCVKGGVRTLSCEPEHALPAARPALHRGQGNMMVQRLKVSLLQGLPGGVVVMLIRGAAPEATPA